MQNIIKSSKVERISLKKKDGYSGDLDCEVDLETKATSTKSMIMQIGAVVFTRKESKFESIQTERFFINIEDVRQSEVYEVCPKTISWWENKDKKDAWKLYLESDDKVPLKKGLTLLVDFLTDYRIKNYWAKPPRFDFSILEYAFNQEGLEVPWKHYQIIDARTIDYLNNIYFIEKQSEFKEEKRMRVNCFLNEKGISLLEHNPVYDCFLQIFDLLYFKEGMEKGKKFDLNSFILNGREGGGEYILTINPKKGE